LSLDTPPDGGMTAAEVLTELGICRSRQPIEALAAADVHRQELVEPLLHALERGLANPEGTPPEEGLLFSYATYLLAKWREPRAYPYFIRWLSLPGESAFDLGGDTPAQDGARFLAGVCGGDLQPIKELILNGEANEFCRGSGLGALAVLAAWEEVPHQTVTDYFLWLAREGLLRESNQVWNELVGACIDIEAVEVFPELRRAYEEDLIDGSVIGLRELDEAEESPRGTKLARFRENSPPIEDVARETYWWACFGGDSFQTIVRESRYEPRRTGSRVKKELEFMEPFSREPILAKPQPVRVANKVGRNEPCPCGSGKKYKKCCGQ
jgi:hypothetical protein